MLFVLEFPVASIILISSPNVAVAGSVTVTEAELQSTNNFSPATTVYAAVFSTHVFAVALLPPPDQPDGTACTH